MERQPQKQDSERKCIQCPREDRPHPKGQKRCPRRLQGALLTAVDTEKGASGSTQASYGPHVYRNQPTEREMTETDVGTLGPAKETVGNRPCGLHTVAGVARPVMGQWWHHLLVQHQGAAWRAAWRNRAGSRGGKGTNLIWDRTTSSGEHSSGPRWGDSKDPTGSPGTQEVTRGPGTLSMRPAGPSAPQSETPTRGKQGAWAKGPLAAQSAWPMESPAENTVPTGSNTSWTSAGLQGMTLAEKQRQEGRELWCAGRWDQVPNPLLIHQDVGEVTNPEF